MTSKQTINYAAAKAVSEFAESGSGARPALQRVNIQNGKIYAADGFRLARATVNTNGFDGQIAPAELLAPAKLAKPAGRTRLTLELHETEEGYAVTGTLSAPRKGCHDAATLPIEVHHERWPDGDSIIPIDHEGDRKVAISPRYLADLGRIASAAGSETVILTVQEDKRQDIPSVIRGALPLKFEFTTADGDKVDGAIMPMVIGR